MMPRPGLGMPFQIMFSESWSCTKTPDAPNSSTTTPTTVAIVYPCGVAALASSLSIAPATSAPTVCVISSAIARRAASSPKIRPATLMTMMRNGAIEKTV